MKNILVTGGTGFIARHVIDELVFRGYKPVLFDYNPPIGLKRHGYEYGLHEFIYGDVRDKRAVFDAVRGVDAVIHLAAILGTPETLESWDKQVTTWDINLNGSRNVFEACKVFRKKCTYIQTGNNNNLNPYAMSKQAAAQVARMYNREFNTKITIIRGLVAYGEGQKHYPVRKVIPTFVVKALNNEPLPVYGDGSQVHDFIYARDLASVLIDPLEMDHEHYDRVIDGGSGHEYSIDKVADMVLKSTNSNSKKMYLPMRPGEPPRDKVVSDDSRNLLKEYNHRTLEQTIEQVVKWYRYSYK